MVSAGEKRRGQRGDPLQRNIHILARVAVAPMLTRMT